MYQAHTRQKSPLARETFFKKASRFVPIVMVLMVATIAYTTTDALAAENAPAIQPNQVSDQVFLPMVSGYSETEANLNNATSYDVVNSAQLTNTNPVVTDPGYQSIKVNRTVSLQIAASDADGDTLTYSATGLPTGLGINAATGIISGTPTLEGSFGVTILVGDGNGGSATAAFTWLIKPPGTSYIGDMVFLDQNGNGLRDVGFGEPGVDGITVRLLNDRGIELKRTTTANGGQYVFANLAAGTYIIAFVSNGLPFTAKNAGDGGLDSDASPSTGRTRPITLGENDWRDWIDAGLNPNRQPATIGGKIFEDLNGNGRFNSGEPSVPSVIAHLKTSSGTEAAVSYPVDGQYGFHRSSGRCLLSCI